VTSVEVPYSIAAALPTLSVFDITNEVSGEVARCGTGSGIAYVSATARSALIRVTERESGFFCDFEELLARLVPMDLSQRERLILMLLGPQTESVPFVDGRMCMGQWQRVLLFGFDGDSRAAWSVTVVGGTAGSPSV
jgi:thiamine phosphate synthase YjbQ (UPF0047 family)